MYSGSFPCRTQPSSCLRQILTRPSQELPGGKPSTGNQVASFFPCVIPVAPKGTCGAELDQRLIPPALLEWTLFPPLLIGLWDQLLLRLLWPGVPHVLSMFGNLLERGLLLPDSSADISMSRTSFYDCMSSFLQSSKQASGQNREWLTLWAKLKWTSAPTLHLWIYFSFYALFHLLFFPVSIFHFFKFFPIFDTYSPPPNTYLSF